MKRHPIPGETDRAAYTLFLLASASATVIFVYGGLTLAMLLGWL